MYTVIAYEGLICTVNCVHVDNIYTNVYILIVDKIHQHFTPLVYSQEQKGMKSKMNTTQGTTFIQF